MFKNYLVTACRNFLRHKIFSLINVLGLSIGISAALVLFLIIYHEFSFDRFEPDAGRIYRVVMAIRQEGQTDYSAAIPAPTGPAARRELSGIELTVPLFQFQGDATAGVTIQKDHAAPVQYKSQPSIIFTNQDYFSLLPYQWLAGQQKLALKDPFTVVLTESRARGYFPGIPLQQIPGRQVTYNDSLHTTVTGIVADLKDPTFFTSLEFISLPTVTETGLRQNFMMDVWNDWMAYSQLFIKVSAGTSPDKVEAGLTTLLHRNNPDAHKDEAHTMDYRLQPLHDVHFEHESFGHRTAHKPTLYALILIAAFLLLLGCINFINLTTARSVKRSREIGIRKTLGSSRQQLIFQFMGETLFVTLVAAALGVAFTPVLLRLFSVFIPGELHFNLLQQPASLVFLLVLVAGVSFLSGIYPAMVLSAHRPVLVLKSQVMAASKNDQVWLRKTLTVTQFVIAQFFVIGTVMVSRQISYALNKDLGFKKEAILTFTIPQDTSTTRRSVLLNKILAIPEVEKASMGFVPPAQEGASYTTIVFNNGNEDIKADVQIRWGDTGYLPLYHIPLVAGRNVLQSDTVREFLVNEKYAAVMGFTNPADAVGKLLHFNGGMKPIVGVMKDFHEQSVHSAIEPLVFTANNSRSNFFHVALRPQDHAGGSWSRAITRLGAVYGQLYPGKTFSYSFFDDSIARFYTADQQTARLLRWATGLAICISCLGLLGLVIYTTNIRTKEIGIRKVMGASVMQIVAILSTGFLRLVVIAFVIAVPPAWWATHRWLQDFSYRTTLSPWIFVLSGAGMILIALLTLSFQTVRAAMNNPVKSLRTE